LKTQKNLTRKKITEPQKQQDFGIFDDNTANTASKKEEGKPLTIFEDDHSSAARQPGSFQIFEEKVTNQSSNKESSLQCSEGGAIFKIFEDAAPSSLPSSEECKGLVPIPENGEASSGGRGALMGAMKEGSRPKPPTVAKTPFTAFKSLAEQPSAIRGSENTITNLTVEGFDDNSHSFGHHHGAVAPVAAATGGGSAGGNKYTKKQRSGGDIEQIAGGPNSLYISSSSHSGSSDL